MPTPSRVVQFFQHMKTKGIGYVRVSTDKQADRGVSLEAQVEKIRAMATVHRSEEHTSELQSRQYLVCRLLLEKTDQIVEGVVIPRGNQGVDAQVGRRVAC